MRIIYLGTGDIGLPTLEWLLGSGHELLGVVTQPDKPAGRRLELLPSPIKVRAQEAGLPVWQPRRIREPEAVAMLSALRPEVLVVMAYGQILPRAVLQLPSVACLNLHASLLPRHRGAAPVQAAILAGDASSGITVMYMDEGLDTGPILLQHAFPLSPQETGGSLHARLAAAGPAALAEALNLLAAGQAPRLPQDDASATHVPKLTREAGQLDWTRPAAELERLVRAYSPWPGAYTLLPAAEGARKLKVHTAAVDARTGTPGAVLAAERDALVIGTGKESLRLLEVQLEGKRRLAAGDFLRGYPVPVGTLLGTV